MNRFESRSKVSYNQKADDYNNTAEGRFTFEYKKKLLECIRVSKGSKVLDVACGNGTFLKMIDSEHEISGYGIDISDKMIANARRLNPNMDFYTATCNHIPFSDAFFDLVTVCCAYHHFPNVEDFAKEAYRLLKPDAYLFVAEIYYPFLIRMVLNPFVPLFKDGDVKFYSPREIIATFQSNGFEKIFFQKDGQVQILGFRKLPSYY